MLTKIDVRKINSVLFLITLLFSTLGLAQKRVLHGKITNGSEVEGIHILNTSSRYNAITNEYGDFFINVNRQDTLVFSSVNYTPIEVVITDEIYKTGTLIMGLEVLVNELDEVLLGPRLSGNIATDLKNIETEETLNFYDVGIPGFKGKGEEKIVPIVAAFFPTNIQIEAIYKYISGYYAKLKMKRKWDAENMTVAQVLMIYSPRFLKDAYQIPENRVYDFVLYCVETTNLRQDFKDEKYAEVLKVFGSKRQVYLERISILEK